MPASTEKGAISAAADCAEFASGNREYTFFNIMSKQRAKKGVINVERELQHSGRGMNNTEGNAA